MVVGNRDGVEERGGSYLSASSRMTSLCLPGGSVTFFCAKPFIRLRTTSIPASVSDQYASCNPQPLFESIASSTSGLDAS